VKFHFWSLVCGLCNWLNRIHTRRWTLELYLWSIAKMSDADDWEEP
jgi:hypothetical protein